MTPVGNDRLCCHSQQPAVTDRLGRRLTIRRLTSLDKLRLFKAAGPILAQNQPWLGMAVLACSVAEIDNVPVPPPGNEQQIEVYGRTVGRFGDCGGRGSA